MFSNIMSHALINKFIVIYSFEILKFMRLNMLTHLDHLKARKTMRRRPRKLPYDHVSNHWIFTRHFTLFKY